MIITYYNLSQDDGERMVYFRSTDVEQMNYHRLLWSVPDEMLYFITKGNPVTVVDKSSNGSKGKIERIFIPVLNSILNGKLSSEHLILREHYNEAMRCLIDDGYLHTKYIYWWKKFEKYGIMGIEIKAVTIFVEKEKSVI